MPKRTYGYILLALLVLSGFGGTPYDNCINPDERKLLVNNLKKSRSEFLTYLNRLSANQVNYRHPGINYSIRELAEHIISSEGSIIRTVENSMKQTPDRSEHNDVCLTDEELIDIFDKGRFSEKSIDRNLSKQFETTAELSSYFNVLRTKHIDYVKKTTEDLRSRITQHPDLGPLDSYQWLLYMSCHSKYHIKQINTIISAPSFPKH